MKTIFDVLAILSGIVGLGNIAFHASTLTPENASMQSARILTVIAFVLVPYLVARAIEKADIKMPSIRLMPARERQVVLQNKPAPAQTPYFDYLFQVDKSGEWATSVAAQMPATKTVGDSRTTVE
ncbi:MAG: hypothetical protein KDE31_37360 [Caldilineaceae bacterium]|nr:hypothetical protein [Caldilineaceae bacterium]